MKTLTLFYRDGANYKFDVEFDVTDEQLSIAAKNNGKPSIEVGDEVTYDDDLGISQEDFHEQIGYDYDNEWDHNFVTVTSIN